MCRLAMGKADRRDLVQGMEYRFRPRNANRDYHWDIAKDLTISRKD